MRGARIPTRSLASAACVSIMSSRARASARSSLWSIASGRRWCHSDTGDGMALGGAGDGRLPGLAASAYLAEGRAGAQPVTCKLRPRATTAVAADHTVEAKDGRTMALSRSSSWKEHRLANRLEVDGRE